MKLKSKIFLIFLTFTSLLLGVFTCLLISNYKNNSVKNVNLINSQTSYENEEFCLSIVIEDFLIFADFKKSNTNLYCVNLSNFNNKKIILDDTIAFAKKHLNINVNKQCYFSLESCEEIINKCGGTTILTKNGDERFILGKEFTDILRCEENCEYVSYLFGMLLKAIFEHEQFNYLYENSNISQIDIINNKDNLKISLCEITCFKCEEVNQ